MWFKVFKKLKAIIILKTDLIYLSLKYRYPRKIILIFGKHLTKNRFNIRSVG